MRYKQVSGNTEFFSRPYGQVSCSYLSIFFYMTDILLPLMSSTREAIYITVTMSVTSCNLDDFQSTDPLSQLTPQKVGQLTPST